MVRGRVRRKRETGLRWLGAAVAPWAAGVGLLISFTASAGTESAIGSSLLVGNDVRITPALPAGTQLIGASVFGEAGTVLPDGGRDRARVGDAPLRGDLKAHARMFPVASRAAKGDASLPVGPSFERSARRFSDPGLALLRVNAGETVTGAISPGSATWNPDLEPEGFVPVPDLGLGPAPAGEEDAPGDTPSLDLSDGATPPIPRAVALSSMTPAPADAVPVEVAASNLALPNASPRLDRGEAPVAEVPESARHRYADLIDPDAMDREQRCLAEAVYFEARSEPEEGQAAVAQVVLNRVKSGLYPSNVCGVVYQNRHRYMGCQFSFACEGKSLRITDAGSWSSATRIARSVIEGRTYLAEVGGATHYHANYVRPGWSRRLKKMDVIGRHIFYALKRGQT